MSFVRYLLLVLLGLTLAACQSNMLKRYEKIQTGMDKDDVLNLMGSPKYSHRKNGKDRFGYVFYQDEQKFEKEVHFENSKVIFTGDIPVGNPTASDHDLQNEAANAELEHNLREKKEQLKKDYRKFETETSGEEEVRYVPEFKPVQ